jgi:hypothetical protein
MFGISKVSSKAKMAVLAMLAFAGTVNARGCTDRDVAAGLAGVAVGAMLNESSHVHRPPPSNDRSCRIETHESCGYVSDYWGTPRYRCVYRKFDTCRGGYYKASVGSNSAAELELADVAETYKLSEDGASKLISALGAAQTAQDDASAQQAFASIGVNLDEAKALGSSGSPTPEMIDRMAKALNQDPKQTAMMVASIAETARSQEAARQQSADSNRN